MLSTGLIHNLLITYNPWKSVELYLTDVIFGAVLILWFLRILWEKVRPATRQIRQPMPRPIKAAMVFLGLFWPMSVISLWQNGFNFTELFALIKIIELGLLFLYVLINIDNIVKLLYTIGAFIGGVVLQAGVGIAQYFAQQSCGLKWFGEADLSPYIQNVAKIVVDGGRILRAYGTLPHANVLGGYLGVAIILWIALTALIYLRLFHVEQSGKFGKLFHVEQFRPTRGIVGLQKATPGLRLQQFFARGFAEGRTAAEGHLTIVYIYVLVFIIFVLGIILSFSRSAWLGIIVGVVLLLLLLRKDIHRFWKLSSFHSRVPIYLAILSTVILISAFYPQITAKVTQFDQNQDQAIAGRAQYNQIALKMIKKTPLFGVGYHNFVERMPQYSAQPLEWWQLQPAHNIYILALAEVGVFGFLCLIIAILTLVIFAIYRLRSRWHRLSDDAQIAFSGILCAVIALLIIGMLDHYLWDIQQGMLLFWLLMGMLAAIYHFEPAPDKWEQAFKLRR